MLPELTAVQILFAPFLIRTFAFALTGYFDHSIHCVLYEIPTIIYSPEPHIALQSVERRSGNLLDPWLVLPELTAVQILFAPFLICTFAFALDWLC